LEYPLRNIKPDRASLAHGRFPWWLLNTATSAHRGRRGRPHHQRPKGGELPWPGLNTKSLAGQMVVGGDKLMPATFCFIVNWEGPVEGFPGIEAEFFAAIKGVLKVLKRDL
jgi:hypothetical protein